MLTTLLLAPFVMNYYTSEDIDRFVRNSNPSDRRLLNQDGDIYEGEVVDGKRQGLGRLTMHWGGVVEGEWRED